MDVNGPLDKCIGTRGAGISTIDLQHVMCVDDDADIRAVTELALRDVGSLEVTMCASGRDALQALAHTNPDLVLLDVMMPEMDGVETLEKIVSEPRTASIPVVMMTAKAQPHEVASYKQAGATDVIAKPFNPMTLASRLREIYRMRG